MLTPVLRRHPFHPTPRARPPGHGPGRVSFERGASRTLIERFVPQSSERQARRDGNESARLCEAPVDAETINIAVGTDCAASTGGIPNPVTRPVLGAARGPEDRRAVVPPADCNAPSCRSQLVNASSRKLRPDPRRGAIDRRYCQHTGRRDYRERNPGERGHKQGEPWTSGEEIATSQRDQPHRTEPERR